MDHLIYWKPYGNCLKIHRTSMVVTVHGNFGPKGISKLALTCDVDSQLIMMLKWLSHSAISLKNNYTSQRFKNIRFEVGRVLLCSKKSASNSWSSWFVSASIGAIADRYPCWRKRFQVNLTPSSGQVMINGLNAHCLSLVNRLISERNQSPMSLIFISFNCPIR